MTLSRSIAEVFVALVAVSVLYPTLWILKGCNWLLDRVP